MPVYLDHAATTAVLPAVVERVAEQMGGLGNASSLHTAGRASRRVVEESRETIAAALGARPSEVVFTSGGTEADNLAVVGTYRRRRADDPSRNRLLVSAVEHHAVLDCVEHLVAHEGARVTWLEVDGEGRVDPGTVRAAIEQQPDDIALVSVMWANNEVGTVQPVREIAAIAHEHDIPFHTDAVQAVGQIPVDFGESGADLLALTGHKIGGPLGVGVLLARRDAALEPLTYGGGQERQIRSGTLDTPAIAGLAVAVDHAVGHLHEHAAHLASLRDKLVHGATAAGYGITVSGPYEVGDVTRRLPGNAHLRVPDCEGDSLLYLLDAAGVECSTGSACQAGVPQPSHVLLAMGVPEAQARGALRLTLGHTSTDADVEAFIAALPAAVERAQRAHRASRGSG
ncbi:cysteine desulfurase family protein [Luteipulveratus sp. YIM 133132]|uniref:cysteine desulfurase family protein n=1 Tax=Luteipulveratus flavus TaxID=3031728 RepID=UPI0023AE8AB2|nr:cysteine desulfurase family protein [Luteipulveratus sp. YIM 133132]MDE9366359.1 cysteine desulfurase family protein [Luteipulveratus sp. YIM 133132]